MREIYERQDDDQKRGGVKGMIIRSRKSEGQTGLGG